MVKAKFHSGLVVYWSLTAFFDRARLKSGWSLAGFGDAVPDERENVSVLKDALNEVFSGSRFLVRPLATRNGFTVVKEIRGEDTNSFETILTAKVFGAELPCITGDRSKEQDILDAYRKHSGRVTSQQVSSALVRILQGLSGTCLRPSGGLYWIPGDQSAKWHSVTEALEIAAEDGKATAYAISHELDAESIVAVRDAIQNEIASESKRLSEEILSGELGERALKSRKAEIAELRDKVLRYESLLGVCLDNLRVALDQVEQSSVSATLLLSANPFQETGSEVGNVAVA